MTEIISAAHDVVFKALFVRNPDLLRAFLRDVLDLPLTDNDKITVLNPEEIPNIADGKLSRLDIHVNTAKRRFNIEMQSRKHGFDAERVLYYWSKMYSDDFESGSKYEQLEQTFSVNILGFKYSDCKEYHSSYSILEDKRFDKLTDKLSIHIFELPKVPKELISGDNKQIWMKLIKADSKEELEMVRTATQDPSIRKGIDAVYELNADTVLREQIRMRDKAIRDYENEMAIARSEGKAEGIAEGKLDTLAELVSDGVLSLADAAKRAGMTVLDFGSKTGLTSKK